MLAGLGTTLVYIFVYMGSSYDIRRRKSVEKFSLLGEKFSKI